MPQNASAIPIAGNGRVHIAPVGTTLPSDHSTALNVAFVELGIITEDGATLRDEKTREPIGGWQSLYPYKYVTTDSSASIAFTLRQWDKATVPLAFGGGAITSVTGPPAHFLYTPPAPSALYERACVVEWDVDTYKFRLIIPKVMPTEALETNLTRNDAANLPITLSVLGTDGTSPYTIRSDFPAMNPA